MEKGGHNNMIRIPHTSVIACFLNVMDYRLCLESLAAAHVKVDDGVHRKGNREKNSDACMIDAEHELSDLT